MESAFLQFDEHTVEAHNYHNDFLILRFGDAEVLGRIGKALFLRQFDFVEEVIVTEVEILLKLNALYSPDRLPLLSEIAIPTPVDAKTYHLPVLFDGPGDWESVLKRTGLTRAEVIAYLTAPLYSVAMLGFLPGFAYLRGLPAELQVPRKSVPAKHVQAGSIAIGGKYLGLYAVDSPGGWHVIGRTPLRILEVPHLPPVPFLPGDQFRIQAIDPAEYERLLAQATTLREYHAHP